MSNSNPSANTATARFVSTAKTAEDLLSKQTEGLVNLSDFRKRRAEALEAKERGLQGGQDALFLKDGGGSGGSGPSSRDGTPDGASTPQSLIPKKKKRKLAGKVKMSFGSDEEGETESPAVETPIDSTSTSRSNTPGTQPKPKKFTPNSSVAAPKALTKSALLREAQEREMLRKEFLAIQERVKATEISIPFVFYDGTNIPGGICRISKGDFIWVFLDRSRKVGAELGVGEKANSRREWARIGVDDLMLVRGTIIIPHHYDFYYFIINHTLGPNNRLLFDYSADPPSTSSTPKPTEEINLDNYNPLSLPSKNKGPAEKKNEVDEKSLEGANDDPTYTKVVDRRWYERNKHIFPASVWQEFDPEKDYQSEVKRDAGGNAFFFS